MSTPQEEIGAKDGQDDFGDDFDDFEEGAADDDFDDFEGDFQGSSTPPGPAASRTAFPFVSSIACPQSHAKTDCILAANTRL